MRREFLPVSVLVLLGACAGNGYDYGRRPASIPSSANTESVKAENAPKPVVQPPVIENTEKYRVVELKKEEEKRRSFVPTALETTPAKQIEIVSAEQVDDYEELIAEFPTAYVAPAATAEKKAHTVAKGETLYSIAKSYDIKVYVLAEHNKIPPPFILKVGDNIEIPSERELLPPPPPPSKPKISESARLDDTKSFVEAPQKQDATVKKGDTVYSLAKAGNVPLKDFILFNKLQPPYSLSVGQTLYYPATAFHIVRKQDTMYSISRQYGVNMASLAKLNKIDDATQIKVGQRLVLPSNTTDLSDTKKKFIVPKPAGGEVVIDTVKKNPKNVKNTAQNQGFTLVEKREVEKVAPPAPAMVGVKFSYPLDGKIVGEFGIKNGGNRNDGINISAPSGTPVKAAQTGIVAYSGNELKGLGNLVIVKHANDYMTIYAHNDSVLVQKGDNVSMGQQIATVGKSGRVSSPQLHFEIRQKTTAMNPMALLKK